MTSRVLSVQHYPKFGGPHNEVVMLTEAFRQRGYETVIAITNEPGTAQERLKEVPGLEVHAIDLDRLHGFGSIPALVKTLVAFPGDVLRLRKLITSLKIDLVRIHGAHNPHGYLAAKLARCPVVWVLSSDIGGARARRVVSVVVPRLANAVLITGTSLIGRYPGLAGRANVFAYFSPVDVSRCTPGTEQDRREAKQALGLDAETVTVGSVATISPQKDPRFLVEIAEAIVQQGPEVHFVLAGGAAPRHAALRQEVEAFVAASPAASNIHLLGERSDVPKVLKAFDVMLIASKFEGIPTTAAEALATGVPVVTCDVGAIRDVVVDGVTGIVAERTINGLAGGVLRLLDDPEMARAMGASGQELVNLRASVESSVEQQAQAYDYALGVVHAGGPSA